MGTPCTLEKRERGEVIIMKTRFLGLGCYRSNFSMLIGGVTNEVGRKSIVRTQKSDKLY